MGRGDGHLGNVAALGSLFGNVHPDEGVRDVADVVEQEADKLSTEWSLDSGLYEAFAALDVTAIADDAAATRLLEKVRKDFRRSGVDRDEETRARITAIRDRLTELDQEFSKIIRDDVRIIRVPAERLAGLPEDWLAAHPAGDDGLVTVTTDYPDSIPARMFAHDQDVRREVVTVFRQRGWPTAEPLFEEMFALRQELATTVGYDNWPSYDADVKMIGSGRGDPGVHRQDQCRGAGADGGRPGGAARALPPGLPRRHRDPAVRLLLLPAAGPRGAVRRRRPAGAHLLRVREGAAGSARRDRTVVRAALRAGRRTRVARGGRGVRRLPRRRGSDSIGRIYLDLHPREGKYKHAAQFTLTDGVAGAQLPEGVLVCNFSRGLMEHEHVVTLFHEFGHLLHHVLGGHGEWHRFAGVATEWDFVEAPSQMLEEWAWDPAVLRSFATDEAGEPIPAELVEAMRRSDDYGKGIYARTQMFYAAMSYWFHADEARRAAGEEVASLTDRMIELQRRYDALPYLEDTHLFASFGHLGGYSSAYYTYMWSLVIAKDMFSAFDGDGDLFSDERLAVATRYRDRVLAPGGTKDAADLVADFLGRPYSFDSYAAWLAR